MASSFFFFNDTATTEIYTLSLHDALPISAAVIEIATAAPWVRKWPSPWVRGPAWDGFWMLSAIWLVPIALWLTYGYSDPESSPLNLFYFGLTALFWIGHRFSSTYLAYCTEAYR